MIFRKKRQATFLALLLAICFAIPAFCGSPFPSLSVFPSQTDGTVINASIWNSSIGNLYIYLTNTLLPQLNVLTTKGDLYTYTGTALQKLGVGGNGQVLTANSSSTGGIYWASSGGLPITTLGDLVIGNSGGSGVRLPVGTNGQVLTADSTQTNGVAWEAPFANAPSGTIIMLNLTYAGSIPAGWVICDGTNNTPNMIGMIPIGAQSSGGSSTPNAAGFGNSIYGTTYGATTHNHSVTVAGSTTGPSASGGQGGNPGGCTSTHFHDFSVTTSTAVASSQPACLGLVFIMKT